MPILAVVHDLLFRSRIEAAAQSLAVPVLFTSGAERPAGPWDAAFVDLHLGSADPLQVIAQLKRDVPEARVIGFCSHVDAALRDQALAAGCDEVLSRSAFVQRLPELVANGARHG